VDLAVKGPRRAVAEYREAGSAGREDTDGTTMMLTPSYHDGLECMSSFQ
jgi:hypothetical protein